MTIMGFERFCEWYFETAFYIHKLAKRDKMDRGIAKELAWVIADPNVYPPRDACDRMIFNDYRSVYFG